MPLNTQPPSSQAKPVSHKRPLKETLWNLFGILFYITVAVGAVYHLVLPYI